MAYQKVFKRYELKYMMTRDQKERILAAMKPYMVMDKFGQSTIRNIYFDTDDYILARHSIAKPDFKEKLRVRSYSKVEDDAKVFVELKRKYDHVVYKRRVALPESAAMNWTTVRSRLNDGSVPSRQLKDEIDYFLSYYKNLRPALFLSYDREAYRMIDESSEFRVNFDENILCRDYDMSLTSEAYGTRILEEGKVLMELKCPGGIPMWMAKVLSEEKIYKTSFSKYGTAYTNLILPALMAEKAALAKLNAKQEASVSQNSYRQPAAVKAPRRREQHRKSYGWKGFTQMTQIFSGNRI